VALWAIETQAQWLPIAFAQGHNQEARYKVAMAAMLAGMSYGTESAGAVHAMSQTAGGVYDLPHGTLTAALLPPVMAYNYLGEPHKYARIAQALGENTWGLTVWEAAELAVESVTRLVKTLEIPTLPEMGIREEDIPMLVELAYADPQTIGNPRDLTRKSYEQIYRSCFDM
jgi:choline dehydrogenase